MTRMIAAAVAVLGLAGAAFAQTSHGPIQGVAAPGCANCGAAPGGAGIGWGGGCKDCDPKFGVNPLFRKLLFWQKGDCNSCKTCGRGLFGNNCAGKPAAGGAGFNPYPNGVPGTLVYPYNPYIRSPRDWFMQDK